MKYTSKIFFIYLLLLCVAIALNLVMAYIGYLEMFVLFGLDIFILFSGGSVAEMFMLKDTRTYLYKRYDVDKAEEYYRNVRILRKIRLAIGIFALTIAAISALVAALR